MGIHPLVLSVERCRRILPDSGGEGLLEESMPPGAEGVNTPAILILEKL
jgi:hypothetical protein